MAIMKISNMLLGCKDHFRTKIDHEVGMEVLVPFKKKIHPTS